MASRFEDILIRKGIIGPDQLAEAEQVARDQSSNLGEALTRLGYAAPEEVTLPRILVNREKVPYGVAIAVGAAIVGHSMLIELGLFL